MPNQHARTSVPHPAASHRRVGSVRLVRVAVALVVLVLAAGAGPADPLFRLVPPESGVILAVEDLRGGAKRVETSSLDDDLKQLPLVASWLNSDRFQRFERATGQVELALGLPIRTILDEVLGDAFVLALQSARDGTVDQSSGLVLIRPRQRKLLQQFMETRNTAQTRRGGLVRVDVRRHGATSYQSRLFNPGARPSDHYVFLDDGTFAWSNSEAIIRDVIDRQAGGRVGWDTSPTFARLRLGLPEHALASLFVTPNVLTQVLTTNRPVSSPARRYFNQVATTYIKAVGGTGFALEWWDGLVLHSHDLLDPRKLPPWMASWMGRPSRPSPLLGTLSTAPFGVISGRFDFAAALRAIRLLVEPADRIAWESAEQAARGLALGQNLDDLLAQVEPHFLITLEPRSGPELRSWVTLVGGITWLGAGRAEAPPWVAVDNAFRTAMAMLAVRPYRRAASFQVETRPINGRPVTELGPPDRSVLAYQSLPDRFVVSNSAEAIGQFAASADAATITSPLAALREKYAANLETFAVFDLPRLTDAVVRSRKMIVRDLANRSERPPAEVDRDLSQFLALANLFQAAVLTSNANRDATEVHRTIGLIAR